MYEQINGAIPKGKLLRHKCDNPHCINPDHLETGTHQDNVNDKVSRGRSAKRNLSKSDIQIIKERIKNRDNKKAIAKDFNVSETTIYRIGTG
jgi:transcriptional regulator with PAS, ATPase and Fis domain